MKILCVLYDDPKDGMTLPTPKAIDFNLSDLLGCVSGELGLRKFLEDRGNTLVVTANKDGELTGIGFHSCSKGRATGVSEEIVKYNK